MVLLRSFVGLALSLAVSAVAADKLCSPSNRCPKSDPACSQYGYCGTSPAHKLGGCDPTGSYKPSSCAPMPRCKSKKLSFRNHKKHYIPLKEYRGNPHVASLTLDSGKAVTGQDGIVLHVGRSGKASAGTSLSTTRYIYYGRSTIRMRHQANHGVVAAIVLLSNTRDEIDWEFTTSNTNDAEVNFFHHWSLDSEPKYGNGVTIGTSSAFNTADWHEYTIDWKPESISWEIDGQVVRTIYRNSYRNNRGSYDFPATPSRLQVSIWSTEGEAKGTQEWSGGAPDWSQANSDGTFVSQIESIEIECATPDHVGKGHAYQFSSRTDAMSGQKAIIATDHKTTV